MSVEGIVKRWNDLGGFGFLKNINPPDPKGEDVFVGRTQLSGNRLIEGKTVRYNLVESPKRPGTMMATDVTGPGLEIISVTAVAKQVGGLQQGVVQKWDEDKGYGFLTPMVGGDDVFVRRDAFGGKGLLIDGLACWFECVVNSGGRSRGHEQLAARNVSGPAVLHRAEEFQIGDMVVFREGTDTRQKNERGAENAWFLPQGKAAKINRIDDECLILDNGKTLSWPTHAALWWRKSFLMVTVGTGGMPKRDHLESSLRIRLAPNLRIKEVRSGAAIGVQEGQTLKWVDRKEVRNLKDMGDKWKEACASNESFEVVIMIQGAGDIRSIKTNGTTAEEIARSIPSAGAVLGVLGGTADPIVRGGDPEERAERKRRREQKKRDREEGRSRRDSRDRSRTRERRDRDRSRDRDRDRDREGRGDSRRDRDRRRGESRDRRRRRDDGSDEDRRGDSRARRRRRRDDGSDDDGSDRRDRRRRDRERGSRERRRRRDDGSDDGRRRRRDDGSDDGERRRRRRDDGSDDGERRRRRRDDGSDDGGSRDRRRRDRDRERGSKRGKESAAQREADDDDDGWSEHKRGE